LIFLIVMRPEGPHDITTFCFMLPLRDNMKQNVDDCFALLRDVKHHVQETMTVSHPPFGGVRNITARSADDCRTPRRGVRHHDILFHTPLRGGCETSRPRDDDCRTPPKGGVRHHDPSGR